MSNSTALTVTRTAALTVTRTADEHDLLCRLWKRAMTIIQQTAHSYALCDGDGCYSLMGAMCEAYRQTTGIGEWIEGVHGYRFRIGPCVRDTVAPEDVLEAFGLDTGDVPRLRQVNML